MSDGPLIMGTERAIAFQVGVGADSTHQKLTTFQNNIEGELGRRGYDAGKSFSREET
jgi:hypothetical protein